MLRHKRFGCSDVYDKDLLARGENGGFGARKGQHLDGSGGFGKKKGQNLNFSAELA